MRSDARSQGHAMGVAVAVLSGSLWCLPCQGQTAGQSPLLRDFIGINGHSVAMTPQVQLYSPVASLVRDYHPMGWDLNTTNAATNFPYAANWVNWQYEYGTWANAGFRTNMDVQFENFAPNGWVNQAADAYRYGRSVGQYFGPAGAGRNLITSVEIGNEPGTYSDASFVTVFRNMAQGIRDTAPTLPIVTCNVHVGANDAYTRSVDVFKANNMLGLVDVLATHTYPFLNGYPTWQRSYPEDSRLTYLSSVQDLINWRNQNAPGKQVWVTEFGYDATTKPNQTTGTFKDMVFVTDKQQAQYLVRSYLAFARMGVDRAYMYYYDDNDEPTLHAASGLTRNFTPKPSYYALAHLQATLGDYRFSEAVREDADSLYIHAYTRESDPSDVIWAIWSPTGSDRQVSVTLADLPGTPLWAEQMPLAAGDAPSVAFQTLAPDQIQLMVGESPVYLHLSVPVPEPTLATLALPAAFALLRRQRRDQPMPLRC